MTHISCVLQLTRDFFWAFPFFFFSQSSVEEKMKGSRRHPKKQRQLSQFIQNAFFCSSSHFQEGLPSFSNKENWLRNSRAMEEYWRPFCFRQRHRLSRYGWYKYIENLWDNKTFDCWQMNKISLCCMTNQGKQQELKH